MNFAQLMYLIDISKTNSINTTAKRMFASQQAVSESIKRLESELNCVLLNRSKTGTELTEAGNYVLEYAIDMVNKYHTILQHFQDENECEHPAGTITIALPPLTSSMLLTKFLLKVQDYQGIHLYVKEYPVELILDLLENKKVDFGLFCLFEKTWSEIDKEYGQFSTTLSYQELYEDKLVCVMSKNNPLNSLRSVTLDEVYERKHTTYYYSVDQVPLKTCLHISNNTKIHQKYMKEENTLCLLPYYAYNLLYPKNEYICIPVSDSKDIHSYIVYRKEDIEKKKHLYQTIVNLITSSIKELL